MKINIKSTTTWSMSSCSSAPSSFIFLTAIAEGGPWASHWQNEGWLMEGWWWRTLSEPEPVTGPWVYTETVYLFILFSCTFWPLFLLFKCILKRFVKVKPETSVHDILWLMSPAPALLYFLASAITFQLNTGNGYLEDKFDIYKHLEPIILLSFTTGPWLLSCKNI